MTNTVSDPTVTSPVPSRETLKSFCERYAYQTRHGTEAGADLVLDALMRYLRQGGSDHAHAIHPPEPETKA